MTSSRPVGHVMPDGVGCCRWIAFGQFQLVWDRSVSVADGASCAFEGVGTQRTNTSQIGRARTSGESRLMVGRAILPSAPGQGGDLGGAVRDRDDEQERPDGRP